MEYKKESSSKIRSILIFCNSNYELYTFIKISKSLQLLGIKSNFITIKPSIYFLLKRKNYKVFFIKKSPLNVANKSVYYLQKLSDVLISPESINNIYSDVYNSILNLARNIKFDVIFIWNGTGILSLPASEAAKKMDIPQLYFEISNIEGKIFIDPRGVNAQSFLYENINILNSFYVDEKLFEIWKNEYLNVRLNNDSPPRKVKRKNINKIILLDYLIARLFKIPLIGDYNIFHKFSLYYFNNQKHLLKEDSLHDKKYLFLPLQLPNDTQLILNSKYDNFEALRIAKEIAVAKNLALIVKPHPLLNNKNYLKQLELARSQNSFQISYQNTTKLILGADEIVTINSTVGLEALILNKKITFLGKSFYVKLNKEYLKNYILAYLIDVSSKKIYTKEFAKDILRRIFLPEKFS